MRRNRPEHNDLWSTLRVIALSVTFGIMGTLAIQALNALAIIHRPDALANMPSQVVEIEREFNKRLDASFPPGTREEIVIAGLSVWVFTFRAIGGELFAFLEIPNFPAQKRSV